jgi:NADPH:quinone reductase and related Zn-dependent oxidoreductases
MRAIVYSEAGDPDVLRLVNRPLPEPGPGEVVVAVRVSGVNPTDWKSRRSARLGAGMPIAEQVPNQDGAGTIHSVGEGVSPTLVGQRVWIWEAAWQRSQGTAQEYVALPARQAVPLPHEASFDLGASIGIPALTAHRCLTISESGPSSLAPGVLSGRVVLVAGGAGAVGHAAIQLARWAGATVIATISTPEKAQIARAAGANHVVDYRRSDAADEIRELAPRGVDVIVEVAPAANAGLDVAIVADHGTVAAYASDADELSVPVRELMFRNIRYQFVLVYTVPPEAKETAVSDVSAAVAAGALPVGEGAGLPLHRFPLERTADAHAAVEAGTVGKVLVDVTT